LRNAILDLTGTFGPRYPRGGEFLQRLAAIESRSARPDTAALADTDDALAALEREALLANPLLCEHPILFVVRRQYRPDHHNTATFFPPAAHEHNDGQFTPGGALKTLDLAQGGRVTSLLETADGVVRDPEVHFDGRRIVFAFRRNAADSYHLYEIQADGSGLRQLTTAPDVDDFDPLYLPDDAIAFSSTREPKYCACNRHLMANLYRMDADGANICQIGKSTLFEGHGVLTPDGRILYDRWEYVDRNFGDAQALWTVHPDGTSHAIYWGNNTAAPGAVIDARIVPGTHRALCVFGSCHDRPWGALALVDPALGLDGPEPVLRTWPADARQRVRANGWELFDAFASVSPKYEDPYPLSATYFLCSRTTGAGEQMGLYLIDVFGNELLVHAEPPGCFDPMPLAPSPRPPVLPPARDFESRTGTFYVQNVYEGTHMTGIPHGTVRSLRVVESPEKRFWTRPAWNGQGQEAPAMNWHDFGNKRILGTVPVEPDGSAYFSVPADTFVYFQLLDADGLMIQSMRSGTIVQPGERAGCVGCHEDRRTTPRVGRTPLALNRPPSALGGWYGPPREFSYLRDVQPVFDKHCVGCHDFGQKAAAVLILAGDRDLVFNTSYNELWRKKLIHVVGAGPPEIQAPYAWGAHASPIIRVLRDRYRDRLSPEELDRVVTWVDLNAPYYPTYASAYPDHHAGRCPLTPAQLAQLQKLTGIPLADLASHNGNRGPAVSFDRPELSPCLAVFPNPNDPRALEALDIIRAGHAQLARQPEADADGFQPCERDAWREAKYLARRDAELARRDAIRSGRKQYDANPGPAAGP